jgi:hypothetical protein
MKLRNSSSTLTLNRGTIFLQYSPKRQTREIHNEGTPKMSPQTLHKRFPSSNFLKSLTNSPTKSPISRFKTKIANLERKLLPEDSPVKKNKHINLAALILPNIVKEEIRERKASMISICQFNTAESDNDFIIPVEKPKKILQLSPLKFNRTIQEPFKPKSSITLTGKFGKLSQIVDRKHSDYVAKCNELKSCLQNGYDKVEFVKFE